MNEKITEIYAWVSLDEGDGDEGIFAFRINGTPMQAVTSKSRILPMIKQLVEDGYSVTGKSMKLCKFELVEVIDYVGKQP